MTLVEFHVIKDCKIKTEMSSFNATLYYVFFFFGLFFFLFSFTSLYPFQVYFSSYETGQSVGGVKTGEPREKPPGTPASRIWLVSRMAKHSGEMIE